MPEETKVEEGRVPQEGGQDLKKVQEELSSLEGAKTALEQRLEAANSQLLSPEYLDYLESKENRGSSKNSVESGEEESPDFDSMSGSELLAHIRGESSKSLKAIESGFSKQLEALGGSIGKLSGKLDVELASIKHPDLKEGLQDKVYRDSFITVANENPSWGAERVYKQLRLERAANKIEEEERRAKREELELQAVSEKGGIPASITERDNISAQEAADMAYRIAFGTKKEE